MDAPVKFSVLKLRNVSRRPRRVSVTGYWEWVLGELRQKSLLHVQTEVDLKTGALLARNPYNTEFADRVAFVDVNDGRARVTGDRREFLGRNGSLSRSRRPSSAHGSPAGSARDWIPAALSRSPSICPTPGAGGELPPRARPERGRRAGPDPAVPPGGRRPRRRSKGSGPIGTGRSARCNVDTPDPAVNVLANGWLLYQTLGCRLWGRTGFYQSGGAFGFRDQLQDVMALVHAEPALTREHLLRAAAQQFREGDVQHWWHPPAGRGVRTHSSDDYLWLPYATCRYVACRRRHRRPRREAFHFIEGRPVKPEEEAYYDLPNRSEESATLYEHCVRAIERGLRFGAHGLPLMGCGDWNDGMNRVGNHGRGESVWLAFFLYDVLTQFAGLARARGDPAFAERCLAQAAAAAAEHRAARLGRRMVPPRLLRQRRAAWIRVQPGVPDRFAAAKLVGDQRRRASRGRSRQAMVVRRPAPGPPDAGLIQLFDPPVRQVPPQSRLHQGLRSRRARERRPIHAWRDLGRHGLRDDGRGRAGVGALRHAQSRSTTARRPRQIAIYKVEPYVVAADVYAVAPHEGRGGWTWYTGSAGWMYRLLVETLLGVNLEGDRLRMAPRMPKAWTSFKVHYRYRQTVYHITVTRLAEDSAEPACFPWTGRRSPEARFSFRTITGSTRRR